MRFIAIFGLFWLLAACSVVPFSREMSPHPQQRSGPQSEGDAPFFAAFDQFSKTGTLEPLSQFTQNYPDSSWVSHAESILHYVRKSDRYEEQLSDLQTEKLQLTAELETSKLANQQLAEKIEQLKKLLIELERRPQ